jgi:hypothetical protein
MASDAAWERLDPLAVVFVGHCLAFIVLPKDTAVWAWVQGDLSPRGVKLAKTAGF